jgi:hypothetical protein
VTRRCRHWGTLHWRFQSTEPAVHYSSERRLLFIITYLKRKSSRIDNGLGREEAGVIVAWMSGSADRGMQGADPGVNWTGRDIDTVQSKARNPAKFPQRTQDAASGSVKVAVYRKYPLKSANKANSDDWVAGCLILQVTSPIFAQICSLNMPLLVCSIPELWERRCFSRGAGYSSALMGGS